MEEIEGVEEFIDESIEELKGARGDGVLDEDALREPVSTLEPRKPVVVGPQTPALEAVAVMRVTIGPRGMTAAAGKMNIVTTGTLARFVLPRFGGFW